MSINATTFNAKLVRKTEGCELGSSHRSEVVARSCELDTQTDEPGLLRETSARVILRPHFFNSITGAIP